MRDETCHHRFGDFTLTMPHLTLTCRGDPVKLGSRALNLLAVLVQAGGGLVPRSALLEAVWPGQTIDDSAIRVHLSAARKALALGGLSGQTIVNEAGRGYRLALAVSRSGAAAPDAPVPLPSVPLPPAPLSTLSSPASTLPRRLGSVIGRGPVVTALTQELTARRFITIAGPGGIGKTTVAIGVAQALAASGLSVHFIDLAPLEAGAALGDTLSNALGLPASGTDGIDRIVQTLALRPAVLLFDNCEHVIEDAALLAERLLQRLPDLLLLATSREPLRAEGEWVHRLAALSVPPQAGEHPDEAATYSAVALFLDRARAANDTLRVDAAAIAAIIDICQQLDGIPLAIELAAARCDAMDPARIAAGLEDRFALLNRGRRTALPRHRTLRAALDWSYAFLDSPARLVLDRLAIFRAAFGSQAVVVMAAGAGVGSEQAGNILADLVAKSLVASVPAGDDGARYRLLDTTRHYGLARLAERGDLAATHRDHALYVRRLLADSVEAWEGKAPREWLAAYSRWINDVRAALQWASRDEGDVALGIDLLIASAPLWFHLSLPREFLDHAQAAMAAIRRTPVDPALEVELLSAYGHALWHVQGPVPAMGDAFASALTLARDLGAQPLALRALWGVWAHRILAGDYADSLTLAERFLAQVGDGGSANHLTGAHMVALSRHFSGDHAGAEVMLMQVLAGDAAPDRAHHANHAQVDGKIAAISLLMRLRWAAGDLPTALALARDCAQDIDLLDHALSACYGLAVGCIPVAIAAGQADLAQRWIDRLARHAGHHGLDHWAAFVPGYGRALGHDAAVPEGISAMQRDMFAVAMGARTGVPWA